MSSLWNHLHLTISLEASKRRVLAAAAAAGVSVAFGSPLGGVLFGLEGESKFGSLSNSSSQCYHAELDSFASETDVMWRGFVASAIAAVALQWVNPFGTAKLVLFQVGRWTSYYWIFPLTC
jgi:chloride channel 3/4/5